MPSTAFAKRLLSRRKKSRACSRRRRLGLPVKLHAEQLSNCGGDRLAAKFGALSADHLEYLDEAGRRGAGQRRHRGGAASGRLLFLEEKQKPPVTLFACRTCRSRSRLTAIPDPRRSPHFSWP